VQELAKRQSSLEVRTCSEQVECMGAHAPVQVAAPGGEPASSGVLSIPTYAQIAHPSFFVGLLLRGAALPYANYGHVVLAQPSPVLFYPISSNEVPPRSDAPSWFP
jgi:squalene monooxygenase